MGYTPCKGRSAVKTSATVSVLAGLGLLLVLPAEAQRGGGHMSFGSKGRGFGGHVGARGGIGVHGGGVRILAPPPGSAHLPRISRLQGLSATPAARPPLIVLRGSFAPLPPRPVSRVALRGPIGQMRPVPVMRRGTFVGHPFLLPRFHHFHHRFGFPFCSPVFGFGFGTPHFGFFRQEFACFPRPFFSPFFFPLAPVAGSVFLLAGPVYAEGPPGTGEQMNEPPGVVEESYRAPGEAQPGESSKQQARPLTLLQLKDGSMYGLTDYWVEDDRLHYITSYGGENSVPLEGIDFGKTVQLNAERGVEFVLRPKPSTR